MAAESEKVMTPAPVATSPSVKEGSDADKTVQKLEEKPKKKPFYREAGTFLRLLFAAQPTWLDVTLIVSGTILAAAAGTPFPLIAIVFGQLVDDMNDATCAAQSSANGFDYEGQINEKIALMAYIAIGAFVIIYAYITIWGVISQRLAHRMRVVYLRALLRQPPSFFDSREGAQDISSSLHSDIAAIQAGTSEKVGIFITSMSFFVTSFVVAFIKQAKLAGMLTSMVPAFLLMSIGGGAFFGKYAARMAESFASASSLAGECLSNIAVVQAFGAATRLEGKFALLTGDASKNGIKKATVAAVQAGLLYFVAYAGNGLAFWQGSHFIANTIDGHGEGTSVGSIYTVIIILVDACVMLGNTAPILPLFGGASAAYQRLLKDIEAPSSIDATSDEGQVLPHDIQSLDIEFKNVSFAYPSRPTQPVLRDVDLSFPNGRYTAIVGLSGSGKSTVAALLSRLYDPTEGSITINGHELKDMNVRGLRSLMGFVQQEPSLMNGTIFSNVARGLINSPGSSHSHLKDFLYSEQMEELSKKEREIMNAAKEFGSQAEEICQLVQYAAEQADAASFIERLENGYGTNVGPKGTLLSGGQRQRVALAQALIRDPRVLVLDEATSALDSASERRIQAAVERAAKNRTVICIAHRLSTIRNADTIIVMEAGKVVEQGSYAELTAREGTTFERMVKLQSLVHKDKSDGDSISSVGASTLVADPATVETSEKTGKTTEKGDDGEKEQAEGPDSTLDVTQPVSSLWRILGRFVRPSLPWLLMAMGAAFIVGLTFPSSGSIIGVTVGELNPCSNTADHIRQNGSLFGGLLFMLGVIELFANFAAWSCFGIVSERLLYLIRVLSFRSLMEQDIHWHQAESPSKLLSIITKDSAAVGGFSGSTLGTVFSILVNFVAAIVLSHIIAWKIALVCLASVPILLGCGFMQLRMLARYEERTAGAFADAASVAVEAVQSIRTVAVLSLEKDTMTTFSRLLREPRKQILRASASTNVWLAMTHSTGKLVHCLSYWWGSRFIMRGEYSQTQFFIVLISMLVSAQLWGTMFNLAPEFSRAHTAMSRTVNIINLGSTRDVSKVAAGAPRIGKSSDVEATPASTEPASTPAPTGDNRGVSIRFDKVNFAYPNRPDVPVLDDVSFTIQPGQFVGLVGPSGAGKSTIMSLVQRLYTPTTGTISLDDRDIKSMSASAFRDNIAIVPQDPTLFSGTVRFNVALGAAPNHEATDEEIEQACRLANIHHVIEALPEGYNTECGPSASRLSGGQRQRLAIARALVRRPRLLLLDESTSALDAESEAALQEGLERASRGTTVLAITHRLHTVQKANVIYVVEDGRVVDSGRHTELMERNQSYKVNATQQMLQ